MTDAAAPTRKGAALHASPEAVAEALLRSYLSDEQNASFTNMRDVRTLSRIYGVNELGALKEVSPSGVEYRFMWTGDFWEPVVHSDGRPRFRLCTIPGGYTSPVRLPHGDAILSLILLIRANEAELWANAYPHPVVYGNLHECEPGSVALDAFHLDRRCPRCRKVIW
jgi:hypothetical protein